MSILENLDRKISKISKGAIQKTKEVSESVRISAIIKDDEEKIRDLYQKIGEYMYQNQNISLDEQLHQLFRVVDQRKQNINDCQQALRKFKKMVTCQNCGTDNPVDALYCTGCGSKLEQPKTIKQKSDHKVCSSCGISMKKDQVFCTNCGANYEDKLAHFQGETGDEPIKKGESSHLEPGIPEIIVQTVVQKKTCKSCGADLVNNQKFCTNCGGLYKEEPQSTTCATCGKNLKPTQQFCTGCGTRIFL